VIVVAEVVKYLANNVLSDYDDVTFESFDTTQLRIVEHVEVAGRVIEIDHNTPRPIKSPWRITGTRMRLELGNETIDSLTSKSREIFSDGVKMLSFHLPGDE